MIRDAGHEMYIPLVVRDSPVSLVDCRHASGLHGYSHESPVAMSVEQQHTILDHTWKQLTDFCGKPPRGSVAPFWEISKEVSIFEI